MNEFEIIVIGGGSAGVAAARAAAGQGAQVGLIEARRPGGHSLFKAQLPLQVVREHMAQSGDRVSLATLMQEVDEKAEQLSQILVKDLQDSGVEWIQGQGSLEGGHQVSVRHNDETSLIKAGKVIIATGSRVKPLPTIPFDDETIFPIDHLLECDAAPASLLIVGGDPAALEAAQLYHLLGIKVFLVDENHRLIHHHDPDLITALEAGFKKQKIKVLLGKKIISIFKGTGQIDITLDGGVKFSTERMMVSGERLGNTAELGIDRLSIEMGSNQEIWMDETLSTSLTGVFAAGSVTGRPRSREVSEEEGRVAGINAAGGTEMIQRGAIPFCLHTEPEIASIGCLSSDAHFKGFRAVEGRYNVSVDEDSGPASGGFCKIIADRDTKRIIGAQILGERATESIHLLQLPLREGASVKELAQSKEENAPTFKAVIKAAKACLRALSPRR